MSSPRSNVCADQRQCRTEKGEPKAARMPVTLIEARAACLEALTTARRKFSSHKLSKKPSEPDITLTFVRSYVSEKTDRQYGLKQVYSSIIPKFNKMRIKTKSLNNHTNNPQTQPSLPATISDISPVLPLCSVAPAVPPLPLSMSRRRLASNIPALSCNVSLPPALSFSHAAQAESTSSFLHKPPIPYLKAACEPSQPFPLTLSFSICCGNSNPVTPLDQILHTPEEPPLLRLRQAQDKKVKSYFNGIGHRGCSWRMKNVDATDSLSGSPKLPRSPGESLEIPYKLDDLDPIDLTEKFLKMQLESEDSLDDHTSACSGDIPQPSTDVPVSPMRNIHYEFIRRHTNGPRPLADNSNITKSALPVSVSIPRTFPAHRGIGLQSPLIIENSSSGLPKGTTTSGYFGVAS
ncbi:hypothetical protein C8Q75DRAFT_586992 [Abortiporus biennis]|nr:hypothetical protein C8Q75DRAFT_586992 [Abortiporus biennis]